MIVHGNGNGVSDSAAHRHTLAAGSSTGWERGHAPQPGLQPILQHRCPPFHCGRIAAHRPSPRRTPLSDQSHTHRLQVPSQHTRAAQDLGSPAAARQPLQHWLHTSWCVHPVFLQALGKHTCAGSGQCRSSYPRKRSLSRASAPPAVSESHSSPKPLQH